MTESRMSRGRFAAAALVIGPGPGERGRGRDDDLCSTDDLVEGAEVEQAELHLRASGLVWDEVEIR